MCRMAIFNGELPINGVSWLRLFSELETAGGGDGNGIGYWHQGQVNIVKGEALSTSQCFSYLSLCAFGIFHTRAASSGMGIGDSWCHPFRAEKYIIAHNGTWNNLNTGKLHLAGLGYDPCGVAALSDTQVITVLIEHYGIDILQIIRGGVFLALADSAEPVLYNFSGQFEMLETENGWLYASEIPKWLSGKQPVLTTTLPSQVVLMHEGPIVTSGEIYERPKRKSIWGWG